MPRQGARRKRAASRVGEAPKRQREPDKEDRVAKALRGSMRGAAVDFDSVFASPGETSEKLFELANKPMVKLSLAGASVQVAQDLGATEHSGGVVWETAFFLARYLQQHVLPDLQASVGGGRPPKIVDVGAGCGLLGLTLAKLGCQVLLTDQGSALQNLSANVAAAGEASGAKAAQLAWGDASDLAAVCEQGPFDLVVASDVVFARRLVGPLLDTVAALMTAKRPSTGDGPPARCWLCVQKRDPDAHEALLEDGPARFHCKQLSFDGLPGFEAAVELECMMFRLGPKQQKKRKSHEVESVGGGGGEDDDPESKTALIAGEPGARKDKKRRRLKDGS